MTISWRYVIIYAWDNKWCAASRAGAVRSLCMRARSSCTRAACISAQVLLKRITSNCYQRAQHRAQAHDAARTRSAAPERDSRACQPSAWIRPGQNRSGGWSGDLGQGEARGSRGCRARAADFARGRWARGAVQRPPSAPANPAAATIRRRLLTFQVLAAV